MLLLTDLINTPDSAYAERSRQMVDLVFALLGPEGGLVAGSNNEQSIMKRPFADGGHESWIYLRQLRTKAWQQSFLDPDIRWTREEGMNFCNNPESAKQPEADFDPMWSQASPEAMEEFRSLDIYNSPMAFNAMSPPHIDWDYLDLVLAGNIEQSGHDSS
jgi:hypothetical protein